MFIILNLWFNIIANVMRTYRVTHKGQIDERNKQVRLIYKINKWDLLVIKYLNMTLLFNLRKI